jgi:hypothetical protein
MKTYGDWRYSSTILHLSTGWRWMDSFMPWPLYLWGKSSLHPLDRRLCGPQSQSGCCEVEKNLLPLLGIQLQPSSPYPITTLTELSRSGQREQLSIAQKRAAVSKSLWARVGIQVVTHHWKEVSFIPSGSRWDISCKSLPPCSCGWDEA